MYGWSTKRYISLRSSPGRLNNGDCGWSRPKGIETERRDRAAELPNTGMVQCGDKDQYTYFLVRETCAVRDPGEESDGVSGKRKSYGSDGVSRI